MCWLHANSSVSAAFPVVQQVGGIVFQKAVTGRFLQPPQRGPQSIVKSIHKEGSVGIHLQGLSHARFPRPMSGFALVHYRPSPLRALLLRPASARNTTESCFSRATHHHFSVSVAGLLHAGRHNGATGSTNPQCGYAAAANSCIAQFVRRRAM